jgi:large subunit ribosomal protein L21
MYAIIASGGKQYKVLENELVKIEKLTSEVGAPVEFDNVLLVADGENIKIGTPYLANTKVIGEVVETGRNEKVTIIKFRRRKHFMKRAGHRQYFTMVKIKSIGGAAK